MRITDARILGGGPPRSRRNSHPSPAPTHPDRLGFTKPLTSTLVVNHGFALTHTVFPSQKYTCGTPAGPIEDRSDYPFSKNQVSLASGSTCPAQTDKQIP